MQTEAIARDSFINSKQDHHNRERIKYATSSIEIMGPYTSFLLHFSAAKFRTVHFLTISLNGVLENVYLVAESLDLSLCELLALIELFDPLI